MSGNQRDNRKVKINKNKEFECFKKCFLKWKDKLGLKDWEILYFVNKDYMEKDTPYCTVNYILEQKQCWVYFYGSNGAKNLNPDKMALHEILHLLLADCETKNVIEHGIIHTIINTFYKSENE